MPENHQQAAEHCNQMIWVVFSVGIGVSLWILYQNLIKTPHIMVLSFGFIVLIYSLMLTISFGQQRKIHYIKLRGDDNKLFLYGRRYLHVRYIGQTILILIAFIYFLFLLDNLFPNLKYYAPWLTLQLLSIVSIMIIFIELVINIMLTWWSK